MQWSRQIIITAHKGCVWSRRGSTMSHTQVYTTTYYLPTMLDNTVITAITDPPVL